MSNNYSGWSLEKLNKEVKKIQKVISTREARDKKAALAKVITTARRNGFELHELVNPEELKKISTNGAAKTKRNTSRKVPPKYRNPTNQEETWTGRGRQPIWVRDALSKGMSFDDIAIK